MKQRFSKRTRLVSALLTLAMVFTFLPFSAFAANTEIDFNSPDFQLDFPDAEFQRFLKERCDTNHNGKLDAQELSITEMTITDDYKIKNLEGIRFFEDLEKLDCHGIGLTTLNVGKNFKLRELDCSYNQLKDYLYMLFEAGAFFGFFVAALLNAARAGQEITIKFEEEDNGTEREYSVGAENCTGTVSAAGRDR